MPDLLNPLVRTPNQVQKVRGFAQKAENITVDGQPVKVQKSFPNARVDVFYHKDDGTEALAPLFDEEGNRLVNSFVTADADGVS